MTTPITQAERDFAIAHLHRTGNQLVEAVSGLSEAQLSFKPTPESWTIAQITEHIVAAEVGVLQLAVGQVLKSPPGPDELREKVQGKTDLVLKAVLDRGTKVQAPDRLVPQGRFATINQTIKAFQQARQQTIAFVEQTQEDLHGFFFPHPIFKELDVYQWMLFQGSHCERHTLQILEVKAAPGFPE